MALSQGDTVEIHDRAPDQADPICESSYYEVLREKLKWG